MSSSATNSPTKSGSYWTPRSPQQAKMASEWGLRVVLGRVPAPSPRCTPAELIC